MSSGLEILLLAPLLWPALVGGGAVVGVAGALSGAAGVAGGAAATGGVIVTGSSVITTGFFATGSVAGAAGVAGGTAGAASGATTSALAGAAGVAGGVVLVAGAAGAALLAAQHLQNTYDAALSDYHHRLESEHGEAQTAQRVHSKNPRRKRRGIFGRERSWSRKVIGRIV